jgi:hypothetical protein
MYSFLAYDWYRDVARLPDWSLGEDPTVSLDITIAPGWKRRAAASDGLSPGNDMMCKEAK